MNDSARLLSYNASLPITPASCNILIVGPSHLAKPLASALLHVQLDASSSSSSNHDNRLLPNALVALDRLYHANHHYNSVSDSPFQRQRQIHIVECWSDWMSTSFTQSLTISNGPSAPRIDHVILVLSPHDVPSGQRLLVESCKRLNDDYLLYPRVSIVSMMTMATSSSNIPMEFLLEDPWKRNDVNPSTLSGESSSAAALLSGVPIFSCWGPSSTSSSSQSSSSKRRNGTREYGEHELHDAKNEDNQLDETTKSSLLVTARMILQRARIGMRRGNSHVPYTCPLLVCDHSLQHPT